MICSKCGNEYKATVNYPEAVAFVYPVTSFFNHKYDDYYRLCPECMDEMLYIFNRFLKEHEIVEESLENERQS